MKNRKTIASLAELAEEAKQNLSNYTGAMQYSGEDVGGLMDDFSGTLSTVKSGTNNRQFTMTVKNNATSARTIYLMPGLGWYPGSSVQGQIKDGAFNSVESATNELVGSGAPKTIASFVDFMRRNPALCRGFKVSSDTSLQISQTMTVIKESPFQDLASEIINLDSYQDEYGFKDKMVTVQHDVQFDDQTKISLVIPASSSCTITFFFYEILNQAVQLKRKLAASNPQTMPTIQVFASDGTPMKIPASKALAAASQQ